MSVIQLYESRQQEEWRLEEQLDACGLTQEDIRQSISDFLTGLGIYELEQVEEQTCRAYKQELIRRGSYTNKAVSERVSALRNVYQTWVGQEYKELFEQVAQSDQPEKELLGNVRRFLIQRGIHNITQMNYELRESYEAYLKGRVSIAHYDRYLKSFDRLTQYGIRKEMDCFAGKYRNRMIYEKQVIFLPYIRNQALAKEFEYVQDKNELVWDFRVKAPEHMKQQVFFILNHVLEHITDAKDRRVRYLLPLQWLYRFCTEQGIADIEQMLLPQVEAFEKVVASKVVNVKNSMQIVENCRKILFISAKEIHWHSTVWYMERMKFAPERMNPSNPVVKISFAEIINPRNRELLQEYIKYQIGITGLTIGNIRAQTYDVKNFLKQFEEENICSIGSERLDAYFKELQAQHEKPETFNKKIISIVKFYDYLNVKKHIHGMPFEPSYYMQKVFPKHLDRSVEESIYMEILLQLKYFPEVPRLVFLNLWCSGMRISEVCTLKGDAFYWDGDDAWVKVYQIKLKADKMIPIPLMLYRIMRFYIEKNHIKAKDFIFKGMDGGAYRSGTFTKIFKEYCEKLNIANGKYLFRSHDYRHTVATIFYENEVSIQAIRDYLGHFNEEMTKQYIDFMPKRIAKANDSFFEKPGNTLATGITVKKRGEKK